MENYKTLLTFSDSNTQCLININILSSLIQFYIPRLPFSLTVLRELKFPFPQTPLEIFTF
jgi:hypothetical protein